MTILTDNSFDSPGPDQNALMSGPEEMQARTKELVQKGDIGHDEEKDKKQDEEKQTDREQVEDIVSDGSASAFEGTEFRDRDDRDREFEKNRKNSADPSGRSDY